MVLRRFFTMCLRRPLAMCTLITGALHRTAGPALPGYLAKDGSGSRRERLRRCGTDQVLWRWKIAL